MGAQHFSVPLASTDASIAPREIACVKCRCETMFHKKYAGKMRNGHPIMLNTAIGAGTCRMR